MSLDELKSVVSPPTKPIRSGSQDEILAITKKIGIQLPRYAFEFGMTYGSGEFSDGELWILNPFDNYSKQVEIILGAFRQRMEADSDFILPYPMHPDIPGLLPWGGDANGNGMFWLTEGNPEDWPTIFHHLDSDNFTRCEFSATTIIANVLSHQMGFPFLSDDSNESLVPKFTPARH